MLVLATLVLGVVGVPTASPAPVEAALSPVRVVATASKTEVTVGETFTIELKATGPPGTTYTFPGEAATEAFELRATRPASGTSSMVSVLLPVVPMLPAASDWVTTML